MSWLCWTYVVVIFVQQKLSKNAYALWDKGRRGGLMVSALVFGSRGPVRALAGDIVLFFLVGKTLNSHSAPLHPGV